MPSFSFIFHFSRDTPADNCNIMFTYLLIITIIGFAALSMAWMPAFSQRFRISYSILYVLFGFVLYSLFTGLPHPDPVQNDIETMRITEMVVIVCLMGTGLKIDQPFSLKSWKVPFRLIFLTMILCIIAVTFCCWYFLNFSISAALLMGAVLAPTDPVLASDVQVGPPLEASKDNVRFSLTAEAGMNDGMAFPFTWLAIKVALLTGAATVDISWIGEWVLIYLLYKIAMGAIIGYLTGRLLAFLLFYLPEKGNFIVVKDGFVAISATLLVYGLTELIGGYGFIAVFITAITLRNYEIGHKYHVKLHSFTDQVERILLAIILILFGGSIATGLLDFLTLESALVGIGFIFIIRPATAMISLIGTSLHLQEKLAISFYGIRGIGSFFYLAYALHAASFATGREMWSMLGFTVLLSIIVHGFTATSVMKKLERRFTEPSPIELKN